MKKEPKIKIRPYSICVPCKQLSFSIARETEDPIFGEPAIRVSVDNEAGGPFLRIKSLLEGLDPGEITVDFEDFDKVVGAAKELRKHYED